MQTFYKTPWLKAEILHFNHVLLSNLIYWGDVQRQKKHKNWVFIQHITDLTVFAIFGSVFLFEQSLAA